MGSGSGWFDAWFFHRDAPPPDFDPRPLADTDVDAFLHASTQRASIMSFEEFAHSLSMHRPWKAGRALVRVRWLRKMAARQNVELR